MNLYKYSIYNGCLRCAEIGPFEEKEKTYCRKYGYPARLKKEQLEKMLISEFTCNHPVLFLLKKDDKKAKELFNDFFEQKLKTLKKDYENECEKCNEILTNIKSS